MLNKLEKALGYKFRDPELLRMALTHTSCANEIYQDPLRSYERLEFLGDSIVGFVTAEYLYRTFPKKLEGDLTRIRAELVCEKSLAAVAERLSLGEHLLLGNGEDQSGGRRRPSILCDVMEAVVAASYLDGGLAVASDIVTRLILPQLAEAEKTHDYKTELQELVQRKKSQQLSYELISETGPDHCKEFNVRVLLNGREVGTGSGTSKKRAEQAAAEAAGHRLRLFRLKAAYRALKTIVKGLLLRQRSALFEDLGLRYIGPIDGHDIPALCDALRAAADDAETICGEDYWPLPSYSKMLYYV